MWSPHHEWHNLVVPERQRYHTHHHQHPKHVRVLATPKPKSPPEIQHHDPYLKTEEELQGKDFSEPFFYAYTKKIKKMKKNDGKPTKAAKQHGHVKSLNKLHHPLRRI